MPHCRFAPYGRSRRGVGTGEEGTAAVELALVLPLLVLLIVGVVRLGIAFNAKIEMSGAAREAARYVVAHQSDGNVLSNARTAAKTASAGLNLTDAEISITGACSASAPYGVINVTISRPYSIMARVPPLPELSFGVSGIGGMQC